MFRTALAGRFGIVVDHGGRLGQRATGEVGAERARLHNGDGDTEWLQLAVQRAGHGFERSLRGGVVARANGHDLDTDGGNVDDCAGSAGAHPGQHRLDHRDRAEELGFEQCADVGVVTFLDGRAVAVAGVVDQHVDATELLFGLADSVGDLGGVSDVEGKWEDAVCIVNGKVGDLPDVAGGDDCIVTRGDNSLGQGATQSGRAPGDEPSGHVNVSFCLVWSPQLTASLSLRGSDWCSR